MNEYQIYLLSLFWWIILLMVMQWVKMFMYKPQDEDYWTMSFYWWAMVAMAISILMYFILTN